MTVENAKEFLVELAENDEATAKIDSAYIQALKAAATELGYTLSDDDVATALVEMTGLGDDELSEVAGFLYLDSLFSPGRGGFGGRAVFGNPLNFQFRRFGT
jgi:hypothetical protein